MSTGYESTLVWLHANHEAVLKALDSLNSCYGVGDIKNYSSAQQSIKWVGTSGVSGTRKFKVHHLKNGGTSIELCGHRQRMGNTMTHKLGIDVQTESKALLIRRLQALKGTISAVDGGVYHEDVTYSQVHVETDKTEAEMDDWLYNYSGAVQYVGVFERKQF